MHPNMFRSFMDHPRSSFSYPCCVADVKTLKYLKSLINYLSILVMWQHVFCVYALCTVWRIAQNCSSAQFFTQYTP
jgi:hypothetical protein